VPPGVQHAIEVVSASNLRTVYFAPALVEKCPGFARHADVHAVETSALIKELVLGLFDQSHGLATHQLIASLLLHALGKASCALTHLPLPSDDTLRRVLLPLLVRHNWQRSIDHLAEEAAMSPRTFTRRFTGDVGMSFRAWRQQARLLASINMLSGEAPIKNIAIRLCYSSSSAYVSAFREAFGFTPEAFRRNQRGATSLHTAPPLRS
jgi:AraC-like DNA-binding protein